MPPAPRRTTILVVEDDEHLRGLYRTALAMAGYTVVPVADGFAALRWIDADRPDAILLDLGLPRLSGGDLQREIASHAATHDIPIIVVTGLVAEQEVNPADCWCVLRKPVEPDEVVKTVRKCVPPPRGFSLFR